MNIIVSSYFVMHNKLGHNETVINEKYYKFVGNPYDNYYSRMVGEVIIENDIYVEIVLHQDGIVMVTKINNDGTLHGKKGTVEYYPQDSELRPKKYKEVLDRLENVYIKLFGEGLEELAEKRILKNGEIK